MVTENTNQREMRPFTAANMPKYRFILPPGLFRFDTRKPLLPQAKQYATLRLQPLVDAKLSAAKATDAVLTEILGKLNAAKELGIADLVTPTGTGAGSVTTFSFATRPLAIPDGIEPIEFLTGLAMQEPSAELIEVEDLVALRVTSRADSGNTISGADIKSETDAWGLDIGEWGQVGSSKLYDTQIQYFIGHPQRANAWMVVVFTASDDDSDEMKQIVEAQSNLFDEIMKTVRFDE